MERESYTPEEEKKKIYIPKDGEIYKLLNLDTEKKKPPEKISMTRGEYLLSILESIDINQKEITARELSTGDLQNNIRKVYNCEALGYRLKFFKQGHQFGFDIRGKQKVGFQPDKK